MLLCALVVTAFSLYGMGTLNRGAVDSGWAVVGSLRAAFQKASDGLASVAANVNGVGTVLDGFANLAAVDINPSAFASHDAVRKTI